MILAFLLSALSCFASNVVDKFVAENGTDYETYEPSCPNLHACINGYSNVSLRFKVEQTLDEAFDKIIWTPPQIAWNGKSKFEFFYDRETKKTYDAKSEDMPPLRVGEIFFLTLEILPSVFIPVVFELVELDKESHRLAFSYVKTNKSNGIQIVKVLRKGPHAEIVHITQYKSGSKFRDEYLYSFFHTALLNDYYKDMFGVKGEPAK